MNTEELMWRTEDDARVMKAWAELQKDPERVAAAKDFLRSEVELMDAAIKGFMEG